MSTPHSTPLYTLPHRSAGDFADLVKRGFYDGMEIQRADGFVVQTGKPDGDSQGFVQDGKVGGAGQAARLQRCSAGGLGEDAACGCSVATAGAAACACVGPDRDHSSTASLRLLTRACIPHTSPASLHCPPPSTPHSCAPSLWRSWSAATRCRCMRKAWRSWAGE